ncbi:hypothetical protein OIN60_22315 [Paenibacillus sp. P96]|uniref:Uncharacterized protein n=1 Tax=Paenibacillus zeirhizosphaerae TaxID=2987519 RepID=A0ABT9FXT6_9BACL|nr:hypothetical protein [Paenibacillus sp. P96]MDP4099455.1 hypothetical protein [Paenibacillus sp. P96]
MNRERRLQSAAASWIKTYHGSSYIRGYRKHFGVNAETAITELRMLGVQLSDDAVRKAKESEQAAAREKQLRKEKRRKRQQEPQRGEDSWSDETFAYIAGYTGWGVPYGVTWEEMESFADQESLYATLPHRNWGQQGGMDSGKDATGFMIERQEGDE